MTFKGWQLRVELAAHTDCIFNFMVTVLMYRPRSVVILVKLYRTLRLSLGYKLDQEVYFLFISCCWRLRVTMVKVVKERVIFGFTLTETKIIHLLLQISCCMNY